MFPQMNQPPIRAMGDYYLDQYFGVWAIEETKANGLLSAASSMRLAEHRHAFITKLEADALERDAAAGDGEAGGPFRGAITRDGVALIPISGVMMKFQSSMSSATGTVDARRQIRSAAVDDRVRGIMLLIDSPGGSVAGTAELADDVKNAAAKKPTWAFGDDLMASAAYWVGSQAAKLGANRTAMVGSLGTLFVTYDWSKAANDQGVKTLVFSTGKFKGAGAIGTEITPEQQNYFQALIDETNTHFVAAVGEGRKMNAAPLFDGRVHVAPSAKKLGLVDEVMSQDEFYSLFVKSLPAAKPSGMRAETETPVPTASDDAPQVEATFVEATPATAGEGVDMSTQQTAGATPGAAGGAQPATLAAPVTNPAAAASTPPTAVAATWAQLKAVCPGASNDFLGSQMEAGATVEAAKDAYMASLIAERNAHAAASAAAASGGTPKVVATTKRTGITPVGGVAAEQKGPSADAFHTFQSRVAAKKAAGMSAIAAVAAVAKEDPDLHAQIVVRP